MLVSSTLSAARTHMRTHDAYACALPARPPARPPARTRVRVCAAGKRGHNYIESIIIYVCAAGKLAAAGAIRNLATNAELQRRFAQPGTVAITI